MRKEKMTKPPENAAFIPVLTVMDHEGVFLWRTENSDVDILEFLLRSEDVVLDVGSAGDWDESVPISGALWRKLSEWSIECESMASCSGEFHDNDWDWLAFHARGQQLARWLKGEVGGAYRVVYEKSRDDPNHRVDNRVEIFADGAMRPLPPACKWFRDGDFCQHIISGGQTGADRAALDFAIEYGYTHGGWAPRGRLAEDGAIPRKYQLTELEGGYRQRTRRNVKDSDATLIVNLGELDGGTLATREYAEKSGKPCFVAQVDSGDYEKTTWEIVAWLQRNDVKTLNVAGPRESKRAGMYQETYELLKAVDEQFRWAY